MESGRLEAFSDGVIAILITIMVLEIKVPHGADVEALRPLVPVLLSYLVSFIYIGIYWNNHHHLLKAADTIDGFVMWANLHLLFWLSLIPPITSWLGEHPDSAWPAALYGIDMLMCGVAWLILQKRLVRTNGPDSALAKALRSDRKGTISAVSYASAVALAFVHPWIADGIYVAIAALWFVPDRRFERATAGSAPHR